MVLRSLNVPMFLRPLISDYGMCFAKRWKLDSMINKSAETIKKVFVYRWQDGHFPTHKKQIREELWPVFLLVSISACDVKIYKHYRTCLVEDWRRSCWSIIYYYHYHHHYYILPLLPLMRYRRSIVGWWINVVLCWKRLRNASRYRNQYVTATIVWSQFLIVHYVLN